MAFLEEILTPLKLDGSVTFKGIVSVLITALKREEHVLISYSSKLSPAKVSDFIEYVMRRIIPLSVSIMDSSGRFAPGKRSRESSPRMRGASKIEDPAKSSGKLESAFLSNICIVEKINEVKDPKPILRVMKELEVNVDNVTVQCPRPFIIVALTPETTILPKSVAISFPFHINIQNLPSSLPQLDAPIRPGFDKFQSEMSRKIFMHKDIDIYAGRLLLRADGTPLVTSFIDAKTKLLLAKAVEDYAMLNGRDFVLPDDVQVIFPYMVTHRLLLPVPGTTFETCRTFIESVIQVTPVPM